ncbi:MAG: hypothetical protein V4773_09805 [Verrucomicrobiota bacterium]
MTDNSTLEMEQAFATAGVNIALRGIEAEVLLELQLNIARRADSMARRLSSDRMVDRRLWLRAEQEIFERAEKQRWEVTAR